MEKSLKSGLSKYKPLSTESPSFAQGQWFKEGLCYYEDSSWLVNKGNPFRLFIPKHLREELSRKPEELFSYEFDSDTIVSRTMDFMLEMDLSILKFLNFIFREGPYLFYLKGFEENIVFRIQEFNESITEYCKNGRKMSYGMLALNGCEKVYFQYMSLFLTMSELLFFNVPLGIREDEVVEQGLRNVMRCFNKIVMPEYAMISSKIRADHEFTIGRAGTYLITSTNIFRIGQRAELKTYKKEGFDRYDFCAGKSSFRPTKVIS